ncbi:aspartate aminotransferase family protein [Rhodococcus sp. H29-C3]|uniref:aspartate aminotransferase family protein n=1 Tax=Rhodococcus sp. H29-C3 TaxID=3046307 RepID=UPI0024B87FDA|nr:aspartate aminotransferase family protein [Rhodococcus sp. H29-C3]MDJ0362548.1 aspartate aminotransferase family protein [Rhodococcus sp. H29-C3]
MTVIETYQQRTPLSRRHFDAASLAIPGGVTRSLNAWPPYPTYIDAGDGKHLRDLDGNRYRDFLGNYTALPLGNTNEAVRTAVTDQLRTGSVYSFSGDLEARLAAMIVGRIAGMERVRFTGSGTEAVMFALRLARAATGRPKIVKAEGGYHGTVDDVMVSNRPPADLAGPRDRPNSVPEMRGIPESRVHDTVIVPFNDPEATEAILRQHHTELAAIIVEPMLGVGGMIPATAGYLQRLRSICDELGILLIFDEVITLRLAVGGAQSFYGVTPDLTTMGKVIGGGLPIGAYGGRADLMALLEPGRGTDVYDARSGGPVLYQGGTFTGNALSLAAGIAALTQLDHPALTALNAHGDHLRDTLNNRLRGARHQACVTGRGSLFNVHIGPTTVDTFRDTRSVNASGQHDFFLGMLNRGFVLAARGMGCISTEHDTLDIDDFVDAAIDAIADLAPRRADISSGSDAASTDLSPQPLEATQ